MLRYRTEIVVPADRYVCLQLPDGLPEGRAMVIVQILGADDPGLSSPEAVGEFHDDRDDIEWWEEFEGDPGRVG